jgi:hypothetical protein
VVIHKQLGALAYHQWGDLLTANLPHTMQFNGTNAQVIHQFQFPFEFRATLLSATGATASTIQAYPAGQDFFNANTDYTFTYNAPLGRMAFIRITPLI